MRSMKTTAGFVSLAFGVILLVALLYDAGDVTRFLGLDPAGSEGAVALAGLGASALAVGLGGRALLRAPARAA